MAIMAAAPGTPTRLVQGQDNDYSHIGMKPRNPNPICLAKHPGNGSMNKSQTIYYFIMTFISLRNLVTI